MEKKDYSVLIGGLITIGLLIIMIAGFFLTRNRSENNESLLKSEEKKIEDLNLDITFVNPKEVFAAIGKEDFLIVDTREKQEYTENHIESSVNIPLQELLENQSLLNKDLNIILVEKEETIEGKKIADKLKKSDFKLNYLQGGLYGYIGTGHELISFGDVTSAQDRAKVSPIDLTTLGAKLQAGERMIYLDVRTKNDFDKDHFDNAINIALEDLETNKKSIPTGKLLIIDENPVRSFQAAVRLSDMNFLTVYYLTNKYSEFREAVKNQTLLK
jgi:rhodanese-related sulfurtransferase